MDLLTSSNKIVFNQDISRQNLQLGYYDLLSPQQEIYDTRFTGKGNTVLITMTSPNDNRFMAKITLEPQHSTAYRLLFLAHPAYAAHEGAAQMVQNILGNTQPHNVNFDVLRFAGEQLLLTPSGQIIRSQ